MGRMKENEFLPYAPEYPSSIRTNHNSDHCDGASRSMKVTRREDGIVDAHCFRCGARGYWAPVVHYLSHAERVERDLVRARAARENDSEAEARGYRLPRDLSYLFSQWGQRPRAWLAESGFTSVIAEQREFGWSEEKQQLWMPVVQEGILAHGPILVGHVLRGFEPKSYLTRALDKSNFWGLYRGPDDGQAGVLVIVEDLLSALRVSQHMDALALLGTSLRPSAFNRIIEERYRKAIVFLDADNPQVRKNARIIARNLPIPTEVLETGRDPKSYTPTELEELLKC